MLKNEKKPLEAPYDNRRTYEFNMSLCCTTQNDKNQTPIAKLFQTDDVGTLAWQSLANVSILLCVIAVLTVFLVLAYKYRCYCLINGWLILSSFLLLFLFSFLYCSEVIKVSLKFIVLKHFTIKVL